MTNGIRYSLVAILIVLAGFWLFTHLEEYTEMESQGYQGEAKTNFLLAADYFLRRMGRRPEKFNPYSNEQDLPDTKDTLLITGQRISLDSRRSQILLGWVEDGGHLIISAKTYSEFDTRIRDHILDPLGVSINWLVEDDTFEDEKPVDVALPHDNDFRLVDFARYQVIDIEKPSETAFNWIISAGANIHGIQLQHGTGRLTVLTDMRMFRNEYIDLYDHAAFLLLLASEQGADSDFYYSLYEDKLSLLAWLWENANLLLVSLLLTMLIILWKIIPRFGPIINITQPVHARFVDHLVAAGNFNWRQGYYGNLLFETRSALLRKIQRKHPEINSRSKQEQLKYFAERSGVAGAELESALFDMQIDKADEFIQKIKILEILRKKL